MRLTHSFVVSAFPQVFVERREDGAMIVTFASEDDRERVLPTVPAGERIPRPVFLDWGAAARWLP